MNMESPKMIAGFCIVGDIAALRGCDISTPVLWQAGHVQRWCASAFFATTSSEFRCNDFNLWLCKGDKSVRITSLNFWLPSMAFSPTFSRPLAEQE